MQKIVRFLESSVEWVALAIALTFLGWCAFYYLLSDPVSRQMEGHTVNPGNVDRAIDEGSAERLRAKIGDVQVPSFTVEKFPSALDSQLSMDSFKPTEIAGGVFDYAPFDNAKLAEQRNPMGEPVERLPTIPAAHPLLVAAALDTFVPPAAAGVVPPGAAPAAAPAGKDTRLVVAAFTIPWSDLYEQWDKSFGPAKPGGAPRLNPADFQILLITAYRSEKIDDQWGKDEEVPAFSNDLPPFPPAGNKNLEVAYLQALAKQPNAAVAPTIPAPVAGVVWKDPLTYLSTPSTNQPGNPETPDQSGASYMPRSSNRFVVNTADMLQSGTLLAQYRGGGPPGGGGGFGGPPRGVAPQRTPTPAEQPPPPPAPVPPAPGTIDPVIVQANPKVVPSPTPIEPIMKLNPVGSPAKSPDLCVYIVDNTAAAGKTYRYRIVYKAANPLFNKAPQKAKDKKWVDQFDLVSPMSEFSPEITVPVQTYFYCGKAQGVNKGGASPFDIFTWSNGKWQKGSFNVNLGDPIGGVDGGVDYSTGYSFVDRHSAKNKIFVTVVDSEGTAEIRDTAKDAGSADYKTKVQWVEQTKNGAQQPSGYPGGQPGFGGPPGGFGGPPGGFGGPPGGFGGPPGGFGGPPGGAR
jgi:hypothetical protein